MLIDMAFITLYNTIIYNTIIIVLLLLLYSLLFTIIKYYDNNMKPRLVTK